MPRVKISHSKLLLPVLQKLAALVLSPLILITLTFQVDDSSVSSLLEDLSVRVPKESVSLQPMTPNDAAIFRTIRSDILAQYLSSRFFFFAVSFAQ